MKAFCLLLALTFSILNKAQGVDLGTILYIPLQLLSTFQLIDTSGRVAINWTQNKNHQDLSKLLPGTYFLVGPNFSRTWVKAN